MSEPIETPQRKKKIAILGGGMAALSTAFELTDYEGWDDHYEVTLYQMGWRLGGKCATGRGPNDRIEEHGIHVFMGFYNNAMRMVRLAYEAWAKAAVHKIPDDYPFHSWEAVFHRQQSIMLPEYSKEQGKWLHWPMVFPENNLVPGIGDPPSNQENIKKIILLFLELILGSPYQLNKNRGCLGGLIHRIWSKIWPRAQPDRLPGAQPGSIPWSKITESHSWWDDLKAEVLKHHGHKNIDEETKYLHHARMIAENLPKNAEEAGKIEHGEGIPHPHSKIIKLLEQYIIKTETKIIKHIHNNPAAKRFWILAQIAVVNFRGLNADCYDPKTGTYDFDRINEMEYRDWLRKWGASEEVLNSAPLKDIYTLVFAYPNGDTSEQGKIAAGTAANGALLIILGYKGVPMYRFHGGTAEVIADPVFNVLKDRGVQFKFFHKIEQVHYSQGAEIESISIQEQVRLKDDAKQFKPTKKIKGIHCWPSHPFWQWEVLADQINPEDLAKLKEGNVNLESAWSGWQGWSSDEKNNLILKKGVDFDQVIMGISIGGVKDVCSEIIAAKEDPRQPSWKDMVDKVATVQTQAVQLWLRNDLAELGMNLPAIGLSCADNPITDTYVNPINSYADMSELLRWECWPQDNEAGSIAYFCGPMYQEGELPPYSDKDFPKQQHQRVVEMAREWFANNTGFLWPDATMPTSPESLDFNLLVDPLNEKHTSGQVKFSRQFFKANIDPSERYVLSLPKSHRYRKKTDETGYDNFFITGDWIDTGLNMGMVECAVMSGLMAAQAVRKTYGFTKHKPILRDF